MAEQLSLLNQTLTVDRPTLRDYQTAGIREVSRLANEGVRRILFVCPTGAGKTVCASHIILKLVEGGMRCLFMAHRIELINQTAVQLARMGVTDIGVIMAGDKRGNLEASTQVASVDTLRNRDAGHFDCIMIDEAHRAESNTYKLIQERYPSALSIGFTATPFRLDGKGLGHSYDEMVVAALPSLLIENGSILCPVIYTSPELPDVSEVKLAMSDFSTAGLGREMMKPKLTGHIIREWKAHAENRRTVAFCVSVDHAKDLALQFREEGIAAEVVHAGTGRDERALVLYRLRLGETKVVCNVDVLTEGWDQPEVKVAILARPTMSLRVHLQQCGRILRPFEGETALILDHAGNCLRHGLPQQDRDYDLDDGTAPTKASMTLIHVCPKCYCTYGGAVNRCPMCHFEPPAQVGTVTTNDAVQLAKLDPTRVFTKADEERLFFQKQMARAKSQGFKPGYASAQWKEKYGKWPPYEWSQHAKSAFEASQEWKDALAARLWRKEVYDRRSNGTFDGELGPKAVPKQGFTVSPDDEEIPF